MAYRGQLANMTQPSIASRLSSAVSQSAPGIAEAFGKMAQEKQENKKLKELGIDVEGLSPETKKTYVEKIMAQKPVDPLKQRKNELEVEKLERDIGKEENKFAPVRGLVNRMKEYIPYVGSGFGTKTFGGALRRDTIQKRAEYDEMAAGIASFFRDLETKGQLPIGLFNAVIKPRLPSSEDSERVNKGRLDGILNIIDEYESSGKVPGFKEKKPSQGKVFMIAPNGEKVEMTPAEANEAMKRNKGWKQA